MRLPALGLFGALAASAVLAIAHAPALAVNRTLGADVPKPAASGAPWSDAEIAALAANVDLALAGAHVLRGAHVGLYAVDARDGRVLYERNQDDLFQPASTLKLLVGSAALDKLGPDFRFHTDAVLTGPVGADGTLAGQVIVRAGGDPFLNDADFDALAQAVAAKGVRAVRDGVAFDVSRHEAPGYLPGWDWDDFPYDYAPVVSALAFEENTVHLTVTPGSVVDGPATVTSAPLPVVRAPADGCSFGVLPVFVPMVTTAASNAKNTVDLVRTPLGCTQVIGAIPFGVQPDTLDAAVAYPTAYAAAALRAALRRHGVAVSAAVAPSDLSVALAPPAAAVVWSHDSEPLRDVLADCWMPSDNLVAELLLRELAIASDGARPGTTANGIAFEKTWLRKLGVDTDALALQDGSGLSTYDRITPHDLVTILLHDWNGPARDTVLDDLPIAGVRGTLKNAFVGSSAEKRLFAKTGSLSHVSTLAGYVATAKRGTVVFAFQVDDWVGESAALRELRARVLSHFVDD